MGVFNISLTAQASNLGKIYEQVFSCKCYARTDITNSGEGKVKAYPDQTTNTPGLEYWGQAGCQHKAQKLIFHTPDFSFII